MCRNRSARGQCQEEEEAAKGKREGCTTQERTTWRIRSLLPIVITLLLPTTYAHNALYQTKCACHARRPMVAAAKVEFVRRRRPAHRVVVSRIRFPHYDTTTCHPPRGEIGYYCQRLLVDDLLLLSDGRRRLRGPSFWAALRNENPTTRPQGPTETDECGQRRRRDSLPCVSLARKTRPRAGRGGGLSDGKEGISHVYVCEEKESARPRGGFAQILGPTHTFRSIDGRHGSVDMHLEIRRAREPHSHYYGGPVLLREISPLFVLGRTSS